MSLDSSIKTRTLSSRRRVLPRTQAWDDTPGVSQTDRLETVATTDQSLEEVLSTINRFPERMLGEGSYTSEPVPLPTVLARYVRNRCYFDLPPEDFKVIRFSRGLDKVTQNIIFCENPGINEVDHYAFSSSYKFCTLHQADEMVDRLVCGEDRLLLEWEFPFAVYQDEEGRFKTVMHPNASINDHLICHGANAIPTATDDQARFYWDILSNRTCLSSPMAADMPNISLACLVPISVTAYIKQDGKAVSHSLDPLELANIAKDLDGFVAFSYEDGNPQVSETYRIVDGTRYTSAFNYTLENDSLLPLEVKDYFNQLRETWKSITTQS